MDSNKIEEPMPEVKDLSRGQVVIRDLNPGQPFALGIILKPGASSDPAGGVIGSPPVCLHITADGTLVPPGDDSVVTQSGVLSMEQSRLLLSYLHTFGVAAAMGLATGQMTTEGLTRLLNGLRKDLAEHGAGVVP